MLHVCPENLSAIGQRYIRDKLLKIFQTWQNAIKILTNIARVSFQKVYEANDVI
jgi:hypothetical protein